MICKKYILFIIWLLSVPSGWVQAQITFRGVAPKTVVMGTPFQLQYAISETKVTDFRLPTSITENFNILSGPSSSWSVSSQNINGKTSTVQSMTYTCVMTAKKEGDFELEPATVKVGNSEYKSNSVAIKVLPPTQTSQTQQQGGGGQQQETAGASGANIRNEDIFIRAIVSKRSVYEQESLTVTFKLYYDNVVLADLTNPNFPEFEGFYAQDADIKNIQWDLEHINGRNYKVGIIKQSVLYPQRSGQLTIGSAKIDAVIRVHIQARGGRTLFEDFFGSPYNDIPKELTSPPITIQVKPLPTGKPASFTGAVGTNFTIKSDINRTSLKVNESITYKLTLKGNGNIKVAKAQDVKFPNDFEVFDPKIQTSSNTKTTEYTAIPRFAGDFTIPPVTFSYFDTQSETYQTISSDEYTLHVEKGEGSDSDSPVLSNYVNQASVKILGKDIRYIKVGEIHLISNKEIFFGSFLYIMSYLMIAILFTVFFVIYRKQVKENANIALVRTRKANKVAVRRLKQAERLLKENREEAFYEEILRALWGYMSDKLNIPQSNLTKENVTIELAKANVDEPLSDALLAIINTCEFARYAPAGASGAMDRLFADTVEVIGKMENAIDINPSIK